MKLEDQQRKIEWKFYADAAHSIECEEEVVLRNVERFIWVEVNSISSTICPIIENTFKRNGSII